MNIRVPILVALITPLACASSAFAQTTQITTAPIAEMENETVVAGFVGSSFGGQLDDGSVDVGGSLSWLWSSVVGAEFLAGFAPNSTLAAGLDDTQINNYMANAIAALPMGEDRRWQPFVSGGIGALTLRTDEDIEQELDIDAADETELAGNIGFGLMGFADQWGFRGDVRYFSQVGDPDAETTFLDDLDFWRANVGLAYRW